jgi:hypothetical protein
VRHAVILSSFIPDTEVAEAVGGYYIALMQKHFPDCTIYIGINTGSSENWRSKIAGSGLDVVACDVPNHLSVTSDVAGVQAVLKTLRSTRAHHDFYWFGHTKGASHDAFFHAEALRDTIERLFWSRRAEIEQYCDPTRHGAFSALPMLASNDSATVVSYLRGVFPALYPPVGAFPTYTFFGMTGAALRNFLASAEERFFSQNLIEGTGLSRYFFEGGFSWVADMAGFEPYVMQGDGTQADHHDLGGPCHPNDFERNRLKVKRAINKWRMNRKGYGFSGWPLWAGERVEFQGHFYEPDDFFRRYPIYAR